MCNPISGQAEKQRKRLYTPFKPRKAIPVLKTIFGVTVADTSNSTSGVTLNSLLL